MDLKLNQLLTLAEARRRRSNMFYKKYSQNLTGGRLCLSFFFIKLYVYSLQFQYIVFPEHHQATASVNLVSSET